MVIAPELGRPYISKRSRTFFRKRRTFEIYERERRKKKKKIVDSTFLVYQLSKKKARRRVSYVIASTEKDRECR